MNAMIQVRNVPEPLHRQLLSRAALSGMSLSDYLLNETRLVAERPTLDELRARLERRVAIPTARRYPHDFLLRRVWDLRNNRTAYDAFHVALAEALDAVLLTHDRRLAAAAGHHARVELV